MAFSLTVRKISGSLRSPASLVKQCLASQVQLNLRIAVLLLSFPPSGCAEHRSPRRHGPARFSRGTRHGCRSVFRQARDGLSENPAAGEKRRHRGRLFWLLLELLPKVTRRRRKTSLRRQEDPGTRASARLAVSDEMVRPDPSLRSG